MIKIKNLIVTAAFTWMYTTQAQATPECTELGYGLAASAKPNKLYLYMPTSNDATYPEFGFGGSATSPAHTFDVAELTSYTGSASALRNGIFDVVTDDYCEFNVEVLQTATAPTAAAARRNTVAIGTDAAPTSGLFGIAQAVDTNDGSAVDFARVWAGTYQADMGGAGGALNGASSTVERWAKGIGGTAAHEAGHNYGLAHGDGLVVGAGEDSLTRHVMAGGSNFTHEQRVGYRRHFSDHEYSVLAANVGLSVQTLWNWDMINPNAATATGLRIRFLSTQASMTVQGPYTGALSPWTAPTVSSALGTQTFKGITYNIFEATWSAPHAWSGPVAGQVAGGASFHVGTGFAGVDYNAPDPIIVLSADLLAAGGGVLGLHPRYVGFDAGTLDAADGSFGINLFNLDGNPIQLENVQVTFLPRLLSIDAMLPGMKEMFDPFGDRFRPWGETRTVATRVSLQGKTSVRIPLANLRQGPKFLQVIDTAACAREDAVKGPDTRSCAQGMTAALFPATTTYITATVVEPAAIRWDPQTKRYIEGPLRTQVFLQLAGRAPDLNKNRQDDFVEIATGRAKDADKNGVIDSVQPKQ